MTAAAAADRAGADGPVYPAWPADLAARYRHQGHWRAETFWDVLRDRAERHGERTAVVSGGVRLTYRRLAERSEALAAGLHALGIRRGDHVVVQLPNSAGMIEAYFALMRIGAVAVLALPAHRRTEILQFTELTEAVAYIVPRRHMGFDHRGLAREAADRCPSLQHVIVAGDAGEDRGGVRFHAIAELYADPGAEPDGLPAPPRPCDVALLQLSGGSTGVPKLIARRHEDYLCAVRSSLDACPLGPESVFLAALPAAHNFPLVSPGILGALHAGATVVMATAPSPDVVFALIEHEGVTITAAVPPLALNWLDAATGTSRDLSSLEVLQVGGAACADDLARRVRPELGATLQQVFGMAEGLINYTRLDDPENVMRETQGRPCCDGDEVRIVDDAGRDVERGRPGHLLARGPYTIRGYFIPRGGEAPDPAAFTEDGYYRTGDLAILRDDGNLVVVGRATEQINRGGEKVSPEEVEGRLLTHPEIHDACVVAVADPDVGERTCAFVIPRAGSALEPRAVPAYLRREGLAAFKIPDLVEVVEQFPAIGVGKTGRAQLRRALAETLRPAAPGSTGTAAAEHSSTEPPEEER